MLRFAPSPTGNMHIGNLRAAIFNYLMARKLGEKFIIRIEDTDLERNIANKDKEILSLLKQFELDYDELIYQSYNFPLHRDLAQRLIKEGKAFYCYCSKEFLESKREEARLQKKAFRYDDSWATLEKGNKTTSPIIRLRANQNISFIDSIKGKISFEAEEIDSFVIMRNEIPTYNFACSIDDKDMSYIIRGEDHISNTPKQILIKQALGFGLNVKYAHLPIILNEENKKMSKRDSASSVQWLLNQGLESQAIANYLILLGNSKIEKNIGELFNYQECMKIFDISQISSNPAHFDYKKMLQINRDLLRQKSPKDFYPIISKATSMTIASESKTCENKECMIPIDSQFDALLGLYLQEVSSIQELSKQIALIFESLPTKREKTEFQNEFDIILQALRKIHTATQDSQSHQSESLSYTQNENLHISLENYENLKNYLIKETNLKGKSFFKPLRMILSGQEHGIELDKLYEAIKPLLHYILRG
ncbi:glutamate--tRNA ligase [Helicobacter didelphidarum]|uniref:Glutamate--tRNA ligase n=1 Tax=Helicobacter didelphidarum TaxID=2040648 RepID=A0A3D8IKT0_9HELI|nr:glutamate--tRNA ligase [Helicobacter didelphidarum]RDU65254.1 glutamate--tRNA ligase [Helicobacter didelphidarum]